MLGPLLCAQLFPLEVGGRTIVISSLIWYMRVYGVGVPLQRAVYNLPA
jgi:hypothetical protein